MAGPRPNKINTSTIKSRILNLAQTSVYQIKMQPPAPVRDFLNNSDPDFDYGTDGLDIELSIGYDRKIPYIHYEVEK